MDINYMVGGGPRGDAGDFRKIFDTYSPAALALAINMLRNRDDAEDACQETFVQVYRNLEHYDSQRSFKTWFTAILYRRCLDQLRRRRRSLALLKKVESDPVLLPSAVPAASPSNRSLPAGLLDRLNAKERLALCLWANDGYTAREISEVLHCSPGTARVRLFEARKKIRKLLEKDHDFLQRC
jgi:RNA polymerase sigma-70 factor, ECF subfamily